MSAVLKSNSKVRDRVSREEWQMRVDLAAAYQLANLYRWTDLIYTHFSARVPGTEDFLINPPPGQPPIPVEARDRVTNLSLGATWLPTRNWQVNCNLTLNDRNQSSNGGSLVTLSPYTAYGGSCAVQFLLQ